MERHPRDGGKRRVQEDIELDWLGEGGVFVYRDRNARKKRAKGSMLVFVWIYVHRRVAAFELEPCICDKIVHLFTEQS
jgi:hypothetical protein